MRKQNRCNILSTFFGVNSEIKQVLGTIFYLLPFKGLGGFQRLKTGTFLRFFEIYPVKYFIQPVYHIKGTYLISTL